MKNGFFQFFFLFFGLLVAILISSLNLLHPSTILDQTIITRKLMSIALGRQFFGGFIVPQAFDEWWLVTGIAQFLSSLYYRKAFGNNEYKYLIYNEMKDVCKYEKEQGLILLDYRYDSKEASKCHFSVKHSHMISTEYLKHAEKKANLVIRLVDDLIGNEIMLQLISKLLSTAQDSSSQKYSPKIWNNLILSTEYFIKLLSSMTSKDIKPLLDQWVSCFDSKFNIQGRSGEFL
jgi:transcription initiation factor TFIID subunit 2